MADHMRFAIDLASAALKLRRARDAGTGVTLTAEDVKILIEAMRLLNGPPRES